MPRPKVAKAIESRTRQTKVNTKAKPGKIAPEFDDDRMHRCVCCGKDYKVQKSNFPYSRSPLFTGNNGYAPVCKRCVEKYYDQLVDFFTGNEEKAIERVCQIMDWYYLDDIWASTRKISADRSRVGAYPSKMGLPQWAKQGSTYLDTIRDRASAVVQSYDEFEDMQDQGETGITKRQIKQWGVGFEESEYKLLDEHYKSLKDSIDTNDIVQDTLARDLCEIKVQQVRARNKGDVDTFQKLTKLYQDTLKSANLKVRTGDMASLNDAEACWGNFIRDVERFCPAEYYQDKQLYKDADGFREYLERFVLRPVRNFFAGTREMDAEYSIGAEDMQDG